MSRQLTIAAALFGGTSFALSAIWGLVAVARWPRRLNEDVRDAPELLAWAQLGLGVWVLVDVVAMIVFGVLGVSLSRGIGRQVVCCGLDVTFFAGTWWRALCCISLTVEPCSA